MTTDHNTALTKLRELGKIVQRMTLQAGDAETADDYADLARDSIDASLIQSEVTGCFSRMKARVKMRETLAKSDTDEALDGAVDKLLDSGDIDPRPMWGENGKAVRSVLPPPVVKLGQGTSETEWPPRDQADFGGGR